MEGNARGSVRLRGGESNLGRKGKDWKRSKSPSFAYEEVTKKAIHQREDGLVKRKKRTKKESGEITFSKERKRSKRSVWRRGGVIVQEGRARGEEKKGAEAMKKGELYLVKIPEKSMFGRGLRVRGKRREKLRSGSGERLNNGCPGRVFFLRRVPETGGRKIRRGALILDNSSIEK